MTDHDQPVLDQFPETECSCERCVACCRRPCWPTPAEAVALIDAGYADRLMLDHWVGSPTGNPADCDVEIVCPANPGYGGCLAPEVDPFSMFVVGPTLLQSGCVFLQDGLCLLHDKGLKPAEGRRGSSCGGVDVYELHKAVAITWESDEGRAAVSRWREMY